MWNVIMLVGALTADGAVFGPVQACVPDVSTSPSSSTCVALQTTESVGLLVPISTEIATIVAGRAHICALVLDGTVRCWDGEDSELFGSGTVVELPGDAVEIATGLDHTCVLLAGGQVACWGRSNLGQLGQASTESHSVDAVVTVDLQAPAVMLAATDNATCALLENSALQCWGDNREGLFGLGTLGVIGDDETPSQVGPAPVPIGILDFTIAANHLCITTQEGENTCAGKNWNGKIRF